MKMMMRRRKGAIIIPQKAAVLTYTEHLKWLQHLIRYAYI
jgi:hypothetical protein